MWNDDFFFFFGIPNKLLILTQTTMNNSTYQAKIGLMMTDGLKEGNGLQKRGMD